jgi:hypothetical protein
MKILPNLMNLYEKPANLVNWNEKHANTCVFE